MTTVRQFLLMVAMLVLVMGSVACVPNQNGGPTEESNSDNGASNAGEESEEVELEDGQVELRVSWWGTQARHDRTLEVIELFEKENPDIVVSPEYSGWDGYWERLSTQAAGGSIPDVFQMDFQYLSEYQSRGLTENLNPFIDSGELNFDEVEDAYLEGGEVDDELYGVSLGANSLAMAYDPAMFEEAGVPEFEPGYTWDDFVEAAYQLKEYYGEGVYVEGPRDYFGFKHYLRQHDQWIFNDSNDGLGYDKKYFIDFFTMWNNLLNDDVVAPPEVTAEIQGDEDELIIHGESPTLLTNSNQIVGLQAAADRPLELALLPHEPGGTQGQFIKPSMFFSMSSNSNEETQEAAAKFIDFFTNNKEANEIMAAERGVPISKEVQDHIYPQLDKYEQMQFDYMDTVEKNSSPIHPLEPAGAGEIESNFQRGLEELRYGEMTVEEFEEKFRTDAEEILSD